GRRMTTVVTTERRRRQRSALVVAQFRFQQRQFWRNRQSAMFSFVMPVLFVVLFGLLFRGSDTADTGGIPYSAFFVAGMSGVVLAGRAVVAKIGVAVTDSISTAASAPAVIQVPFLVRRFATGGFCPYRHEREPAKTGASIVPLGWLIDAPRAGEVSVGCLHA